MRYRPQQNAQNARCGQCLWLQVPVKQNCGLEHGQPAHRTMSKVIFDGFPWVFDPFCSQSSQNGVPIVQLMFLYEARARARLVQEHHPHNWDPTFWPLSVKLERSGSSKPTKTSQATRAGWARGRPGRPVPQALNSREGITMVAAHGTVSTRPESQKFQICTHHGIKLCKSLQNTDFVASFQKRTLNTTP